MDPVNGHTQQTPPPARDPRVATSATPVGTAGRSFAQRFFGVVARPRTYLNLIYLALAFPLGVFYFSFFVAMLSTAIGTIIVWIGIPLLALTALLWWAFAAMERYLADGLLGTHLVPAPRPWRQATGVWPRIKAHMGAAATWKDLVFLFVKFPLGIVSLVVITVVVSLPAAFITAPLTVGWADWSSTPVSPEDRGFYIQTWHVDQVAEAIVFVPIGVLLLFVGLHVVNGMATLWKLAAGALLESEGPRRGVAGAAEAPLAPTGARPAAPLPQPPADWTPTYAPGTPGATASYLNVPQPTRLGYLYPDPSGTGVTPTAAPVPEPTAALPEPGSFETHPPTPQRRTQPPKPPIWEEDDA